MEPGLRCKRGPPGSPFLWLCVTCAVQVLPACGLTGAVTGGPATLGLGHTVLPVPLRGQASKGVPRSREAGQHQNGKWTSLPFSHRETYQGGESALPAQRKSSIEAMADFLIIINF